MADLGLGVSVDNWHKHGKKNQKDIEKSAESFIHALHKTEKNLLFPTKIRANFA